MPPNTFIPVDEDGKDVAPDKAAEVLGEMNKEGGESPEQSEGPTTRPFRVCDWLDFIHCVDDIPALADTIRSMPAERVVNAIQSGNVGEAFENEVVTVVLKAIVKYSYWCDFIQQNKTPNPWAVFIEKVLNDESSKMWLMKLIRLGVRIIEPVGTIRPSDRPVDPIGIDVVNRWQEIACVMSNMLSSFLTAERGRESAKTDHPESGDGQ
jgi:hypothetical protein